MTPSAQLAPRPERRCPLLGRELHPNQLSVKTPSPSYDDIPHNVMPIDWYCMCGMRRAAIAMLPETTVATLICIWHSAYTDRRKFLGDEAMGWAATPRRCSHLVHGHRESARGDVGVCPPASRDRKDTWPTGSRPLRSPSHHPMTMLSLTPVGANALAAVQAPGWSTELSSLAALAYATRRPVAKPLLRCRPVGDVTSADSCLWLDRPSGLYGWSMRDGIRCLTDDRKSINSLRPI